MLTAHFFVCSISGFVSSLLVAIAAYSELKSKVMVLISSHRILYYIFHLKLGTHVHINVEVI